MTMHLTMVKKATGDASDCRKCAEATEYLQARGLWDRVDEVIWATEDDPSSAGMQLGARFGINRVPFFVVRENGHETVYTSVLQLVRERLGKAVSAQEEVRAIDVDDIGGI